MEQITGSEHTRKCTMCGGVFKGTLEFFYKKTGGKGGLTTACKVCHRERQQARPEHYTNKRRSSLKIKYGITLEDYERMFRNQGGVCAVCSKAQIGRELCVDHNHTTLAVRGLLCTACNKAIGQLGDTAESLRKALAYLDKDTDTH